jgi:hypothetical protein
VATSNVPVVAIGVLALLGVADATAGGWSPHSSIDAITDEAIAGVATTAEDGHTVAVIRRGSGPVYLVVTPPPGATGPARASSFRPAWRVDALKAHEHVDEASLKRMGLAGLQEVRAGSLMMRVWAGDPSAPPAALAELLNGRLLTIRYGNLADRPVMVRVPLAGIKDAAIDALQIDAGAMDAAIGQAKRSSECKALSVAVDYSVCMSRQDECQSSNPEAGAARTACLTAR